MYMLWWSSRCERRISFYIASRRADTTAMTEPVTRVSMPELSSKDDGRRAICSLLVADMVWTGRQRAEATM